MARNARLESIIAIIINISISSISLIVLSYSFFWRSLKNPYPEASIPVRLKNTDCTRLSRIYLFSSSCSTSSTNPPHITSLRGATLTTDKAPSLLLRISFVGISLMIPGTIWVSVFTPGFAAHTGFSAVIL